MMNSSITGAGAIPFLDLQASYLELKSEIDAALSRVAARGWYVLGEEVRAFEQEFAHYCGAAHCVGVSNGLDALHLVLRAWDVGPGDEVIVPSNTFIATWLAVSYAGATPVPVEPDPETMNIDPERIEAAVTARTKVMIPVHLYGQPVDSDAIAAIARRHGIRILEDAAQAHGARYKGRRAGALGDAAAFSFYPAKNLGAFGDGGAVVTDNVQLAARVRILANYGSPSKYQHVEKGFNCRLDEIQAAVLRAKLPRLDAWNERRRTIAAQYRASIQSPEIALPSVAHDVEPVWHLFVIRSTRRDAIQKSLADAGIGSQVHYPVPPFEQAAYAELAGRANEWPLARRMARQALSIPIGPHISAEQAVRIAEVVDRAAR